MDKRGDSAVTYKSKTTYIQLNDYDYDVVIDYISVRWMSELVETRPGEFPTTDRWPELDELEITVTLDGNPVDKKTHDAIHEKLSEDVDHWTEFL